MEKDEAKTPEEDPEMKEGPGNSDKDDKIELVDEYIDGIDAFYEDDKERKPHWLGRGLLSVTGIGVTVALAVTLTATCFGIWKTAAYGTWQDADGTTHFAYINGVREKAIGAYKAAESLQKSSLQFADDAYSESSGFACDSASERVRYQKELKRFDDAFASVRGAAAASTYREAEDGDADRKNYEETPYGCGRYFLSDRYFYTSELSFNPTEATLDDGTVDKGLFTEKETEDYVNLADGLQAYMNDFCIVWTAYTLVLSVESSGDSSASISPYDAEKIKKSLEAGAEALTDEYNARMSEIFVQKGGQ
jgi:hypothetical protein